MGAGLASGCDQGLRGLPRADGGEAPLQGGRDVEIPPEGLVELVGAKLGIPLGEVGQGQGLLTPIRRVRRAARQMNGKTRVPATVQGPGPSRSASGNLALSLSRIA